MVGLVWAVAFTLGPLIGGGFTEGVSWRWCFYINCKCAILGDRQATTWAPWLTYPVSLDMVTKLICFTVPISGFAFAVIAWKLKTHTPRTPLLAGLKAVDWVGSVTLIGGTLMFLLGLQFGGTLHPWNSITVICLLVFGVVTLVLFVTIERYFARYPIVPTHLYAGASNLAILLVDLFHGIVFTENTYFLPLYCQSTLQFGPLLSGILLLPFATLLSIATIGAGAYVKRTGRYHDCIPLGAALLVLGSGLQYNLPDSRYWPKIIIYQLIPGFGIGLNFQPPLLALQSNVPAQDNGPATASFALVRNVASAIGVVVGSVIFANRMDAQQHTLVDALGAETAQLFSGSNAQANTVLISGLGSEQRDIVRKAFCASIRDIWISAAGMAGGALLASLFIKRNKLNQSHVEVKTGLAGEEERRRIMLEQRVRKQQAEAEAKGPSASQ